MATRSRARSVPSRIEHETFDFGAAEIDTDAHALSSVYPDSSCVRALRFDDMDGQGKDPSAIAGSGTSGPWRKRPSTILWVLSLGQLITWGLVYYTFPLFVVPMENGARLVAHRDVRRAVGRPAGGGPVLDPGRRLDRSRPWRGC